MKKTNWKPKNEELESLECAWVNIKDSCEKLKQETNAQNTDIRKILQEISDRYYS